MPRHNKTGVFINDSDYYEPLRKERNVKQIEQYNTPIMNNPSVPQRAATATDNHIWKYGDRLYNLAYTYYGDTSFWWVIAWWNGYGTEADIRTGAVLRIPLDIAIALTVLGV